VAPGVGDGSLLSGAHPVFDLGKGLLDRIEVGRIWRQVPQPGTGGADHAAEHGCLVASEIVHDDDITALELRNKLLFDVGAKAFAVDGAVEHTRGGELVAAESGEEGQGAPVSLWREAAQPIALWPPSAQRRHISLDPGLVDENQPLGVKMGLLRPPAPSPAGNIRAGLLKREQRFF